MDIDFVVPWVDGSDPAWLAEKFQYSPVKKSDADSVNRYRDWGLMPFWFRAVEKFTPWVRKIHFVTWGHLPEFLNTENPKLHIVNHRDYIPEEYLPTFSANPIEMNMHRIPELSEHFVYFNDDMFLLKSMSPNDFFDGKSGMPKSQAPETPIGFTDNEVWQYLVANDLCVINKYFHKFRVFQKFFPKFINYRYPLVDNMRSLGMFCLFPKLFYGFKNFHAPAAYLKSTFKELWEKEPDLLKNTSSHKFRSKEDVNQWLALWWQVASGKFSPKRMKTLTFAPNENNLADLDSIIKKQKFEMICINDPISCQNYEFLSTRVKIAFASILTKKSEFEK